MNKKIYNSYAALTSDFIPLECCDFNNGVQSVQMRRLENGQFQIRENEYGEWKDCEVDFDEYGNFKSLSYVIKAVPLL